MRIQTIDNIAQFYQFKHAEYSKHTQDLHELNLPTTFNSNLHTAKKEKGLKRGSLGIIHLIEGYGGHRIQKKPGF